VKLQLSKIDPFVGELLFDHDCVIITDLGGFVASQKQAAINPALHVLSPASKRIAFNASLRNNDGLLASHISLRTGMTYPEACDTIRDYVNEAFRNFESGKRVNIEKVGVLFMDAHKNLQFLPDNNSNFLIDSFGLAPVHTPVVRRDENVTERKEAVVKPFKIPAQRTGKRGIGVLEMIPAAAVLAILFITPPALQQLNTQLSGMLPFSRINEYIHEFTGKSDDRPKPSLNIVLPSPFLIPPRHLESKTSSDTGTVTATPAVGNQPQASPAAPEMVRENGGKESAQAQGYHVIGGCFKSEENALRFINEMKAKGADARMIGLSPAGLHMVSLYHTDSRSEADVKLKNVTDAGQKSWIWSAE
jgi:hypothetical protein